jgi:Flp pilus assembly pilin Flp
VNSSITRYRDNRSIAYLAGATRAVGLGFMAAGVSVCLIAGVETLGTLLSWLGL